MGWFDRWFRRNKIVSPSKQALPDELTPARVKQSPSLVTPFETVQLDGESVLIELIRLQVDHPNSVAVLLGDVAVFRINPENMVHHDEQRANALTKATQIDFEQWVAARVRKDPEYFDIEVADWPDETPSNQMLTLHLDTLSQKPKKKVSIGLLPIDEPWQAPAYLDYGGWNECPLPEEHTAIHLRWQEQYGATIACMSGDVIECKVSNPPLTKEAALKLAREQFVYSPDIVLQGTGSIEALAAGLLGASVWFFWWD